MPWFSNLAGKASQMTDSLVDRCQERVDGLAAGTGLDLRGAVRDLKETAVKCHQSAEDTIRICDSTKQKRDEMLEFGREIQSTMTKLKDRTDDTTVLETIRDLMDGQKLEAAIDIARGLDEAALECVNKSIDMMEVMESGMDGLPDIIQKPLEQAAASHVQKADRHDDAAALLRDLDGDVQDVKACIEEIRQLNLVTGLKLGLEAFTQLTDKAARSRSMFDAVRSYAAEVHSICQAFRDLDVKTVARRSKDLLTCVGLTESMRKLAEGAGRLAEVIISLFRVTSERIATLWGALAFAKDCMSDCTDLVTSAKQLTMHARDRTTSLIDKSSKIRDRLQRVGKIDRESVQAIRQLASDGEIQEVIDLAGNVDDLVIESTTTTVRMVDRVTEGYRNFPEILTEGIRVEEAGGQDDDPAPADVARDVVELEQSRGAVEESDVWSTARSGAEAFRGVSVKAGDCRDLLDTVEQFASSCHETIASFLGIWDLESAVTKVTEMCRLVRLGEMMKQFAEQIQSLLAAMVELLKTTMDKLSNLDWKDVSNSVMEQATTTVTDSIGQLQNINVSSITHSVEQAAQKADLGELGGAVSNTLEHVSDDIEGAVDAVKDKFKTFW